MLKIIIFVTIAVVFQLCESEENFNNEKFPDDFIFGVASSAYQTEGAWNVDGKSENIWDYYVHNYPEKIVDRSNADIACDSYHKVKEDVEILSNLGVNFYRFSISWARILPSGFTNKINPLGIKYYNNLIDQLLAKNITPFVTLYHWDLPQSLSNLGGFANPLVVEWFTNYAKVAFENFGDRVKNWTTFNEPRLICSFGYGLGSHAPGYNLSGIADYICGHNILKAHARVYHLYSEKFRPKQKGTIGIIVDCPGFAPASDSLQDVEAADRRFQFECGWFSQPIFSKDGDYPDIMKKLIAQRSKEEGFKKSRLPVFTSDEIKYIKGTSEYIGLNHYSTFIVSNKIYPIDCPSLDKDSQTIVSLNLNWTNTAFVAFKVVPWGLRKVLKQFKDNYGDHVIYVTENGYAGLPGINDKERIRYHTLYLHNILDSIYKDGVRLKGYTAWSLIDYFEWKYGYTFSYGLYQVDYSDPKRKRIAKDSAKFYSKLIANRKLPKLQN